MVQSKSPDGVAVLLQHGARANLKCWGDCIPETPLEAAERYLDHEPSKNLKLIIALLKDPSKASYKRKSDPETPSLSAEEKAIDRAVEVENKTGMRFQDENF